MEDAGAHFMAVHPRTRMQMYAGKSDWAVIREVKKAVKVPVIASGDVYTVEDFARVTKETNCDGVMLARGILGNFHLIKEIHASLQNINIEEQSPREKMQLLEQHLDLLIKYKGEEIATKEIRKFFAWYTKNLPGAARLRTEVNSIKSSHVFKDFLNKINEDDYFAGRDSFSNP
jgi:tRNA-dihydrouridine synthase